jgi:hypothetical protein
MSTTFEPAETGVDALSSAEIAAWVEQLSDVDINASDAELIDRITQLERLKSACSAAQAVFTMTFVESQTDGLPAAKARDERSHRSIAAQVALARKDSPVRGGRHVGLAKALIREMPNTLTALRAGEISEWRATLLVKETACLSREHRQQVDAELAGKLAGLGDRGTERAAAKIAQRLDAAACVKRHRKAVSERRVSIRPAPDTMTYVSALLPVAHGVAVYAALMKHADTARATGDPRSRGQVMADELVNRITQPDAAAAGDAEETVVISDRAEPRTSAAPTASPAQETVNQTGDGATDSPTPASVPTGANLDIQLVMTDRTLFDGDNEPAHLVGYGPIPAPLARQLIRDANPKVKAWVRRLYTEQKSGHLMNGDARRRFSGHAERQFLIARDQFCRTPYCDAPIRHGDHVEGHANGPADLSKGQGLCESCNYTKEMAGWTSRVEPGGNAVAITTPTGHAYISESPPPPRSTPWVEMPSAVGPARIDIVFPEIRYRRRFEVA